MLLRRVYPVEGIGRFYLGLANHIRILQTSELEKFVKSYANDYLIIS